jgi:hypothetical protein
MTNQQDAMLSALEQLMDMVEKTAFHNETLKKIIEEQKQCIHEQQDMIDLLRRSKRHK